MTEPHSNGEWQHGRNIIEREGCTSMSYEHYDCKVCGAHVALDYEEMR